MLSSPRKPSSTMRIYPLPNNVCVWNDKRYQPFHLERDIINLPLQEFPMKNILPGICASVLALTFGLATIAPVSAASVHIPRASEFSTNVQTVQSGPDWRRNGNRSGNRMQRQHRGGFEHRGNRSYYNGHRGYKEPRRGYRQHNGVWFPAAAFVTGAIVGGAINNQPRARSNAHVRSCQNRYRSYRASDNTFQPNNGPRRQCVSS